MAATVLHLTTLFGGGVDRYLRDIAACVPGRHLFWHAGDSADVVEDPAAKRFTALDPAKVDASPQALAALLRQERVGLVHLHSTAASARKRAAQFARACDAPRITSLHDILFLRSDGFDAPSGAAPDAAWLGETSAVLRESAAVLAPSRYIADLAREHIPGLPVEVVANGSPPAKPAAPATARAEFAQYPCRHVVAVLGAIGPHKGSELLEELPAHLAHTDICIVVIGYLDRQLFPGWRVPGRLYVHGAYGDDDVAGLLKAYGARLALFPNRVPESFSYALSDCWAAGVPVLAAPVGALAERVREHACGWLLPGECDARQVADRLRHIFAHTGPAGLAEVESALSRPDPTRVPALDTMARSLDAFYRRFAIDPAAREAAGEEALQQLLAANIDGSVFRQELVRLADEYEQVKTALDGERGRTEQFERESREWMAKLERDIDVLKAELALEVAMRRDLGQQIVQLTIQKDAFELLPEIVRKFLLKKILDARG